MPVAAIIAVTALIVFGVLFSYFFYYKIIRAANKVIELSEEIRQIKEELRRINTHISRDRD